MKKIITSESVNIGHPDKTCDFVADSFLDEALKQDINAQMAVECAIKDDLLMIYGEATTTAKIDYEKVARKALKDIGYKNEFRIIKQISEQSTDIHMAVCGNKLPENRIVDNSASTIYLATNQALELEEIKAGDQGIVYGYACDETEEFMPLPIVVAHKLMRAYDAFRRNYKGGEAFFPDAKSQVSVEYEEDAVKKIHTVLISASHSERMTYEEVVALIKHNVIDAVLTQYDNFVTTDTKYIINPSGRFTIWGSFGDSGSVGRKIVVDTYGGVGRVGGGCFSSKNATKVDRSAAYYARYVAKNIVATKLARRCEIGVSYAIALAEPISLNIDCFDTETIKLEDVYKFVNNNFCFRPSNIIKELDLLKPVYKQTACYGHFGRDEFAWERIKFK